MRRTSHAPCEDAVPGSAVGFEAEVPSAGIYRLFFDFQVDGVVRTADFTLRTETSDVPTDFGPDIGTLAPLVSDALSLDITLSQPASDTDELAHDQHDRPDRRADGLSTGTTHIRRHTPGPAPRTIRQCCDRRPQ